MSNDENQLNAGQLLLLAGAFEKLAQCYAEEAKQKSLRSPFEIAEDMIRNAIATNDADGYRQAIRLFDSIKKALESTLLE
jgi:hypothetical protein